TQHQPAILQHKYDRNRAEDALLNSYGLDRSGVIRDWNEEYQSSHETECKNEEERLRLDGQLYRIYSEFVLAASEGAMAVINGHIAPVNPLDVPKQHVFIYNHIFFSYAVDSRDMYTDIGGDLISHKHAAADIHGVNAYQALE